MEMPWWSPGIGASGHMVNSRTVTSSRTVTGPPPLLPRSIKIQSTMHHILHFKSSDHILVRSREGGGETRMFFPLQFLHLQMANCPYTCMGKGYSQTHTHTQIIFKERRGVSNHYTPPPPPPRTRLAIIILIVL